MFDLIRQDFNTHGRKWFNWGFRAMLVYRFGRWRYTIPLKILRVPFSLVYKYLHFRMMGRGIELPCEVDVGPGFRIDHQGGIVISGYAKFGAHCVIRNGVTVGLARVEDPVAPVFGDHVDIGTGATILGRIRIGDHVKIGAGAVVLTDIPSHSLAVGVPAKIRPLKESAEKLES